MAQNSVKSLLQFNTKNPKFGSYLLFLIALLVSLFLILTSVNLVGNTLVYLAIAIGFLGIFLMIAKPKFWIYSIILLIGLFGTDTGGGISATDVLFAIYFNLTLYLWLLYNVIINKKKIITNRLEWLLVALFVFILITSITTYYYNIEFLLWLREYSLFTLVLYYFPFKEYISDKETVINVMLLFLISAIFSELIQLYRYKNMISNVIYAYQLGTSIRINQTLYIVAVSFSFLYIFDIKNLILRYLNLFTIILGTTALISTYSRIFWASLILNFFLIFIFINHKEKIKALGYVLLSVSLVYSAAYFLFGDFLDIALAFIERRFTSSTKGTQDISALSRFAEWDMVMSLIMESPFLGQGYGNPFTFKNPITTWKEYSITIHNGYLFLAYRIGIPLALFYITFFFSMFFKSIFLTLKIKSDIFYKRLIFGVSLVFLSIFITNFLTSTFVQRDGLMISALCYSLVFFVSKKYDSGEIK